MAGGRRMDRSGSSASSAHSPSGTPSALHTPSPTNGKTPKATGGKVPKVRDAKRAGAGGTPSGGAPRGHISLTVRPEAGGGLRALPLSTRSRVTGDEPSSRSLSVSPRDSRAVERDQGPPEGGGLRRAGASGLSLGDVPQVAMRGDMRMSGLAPEDVQLVGRSGSSGSGLGGWAQMLGGFFSGPVLPMQASAQEPAEAAAAASDPGGSPRHESGRVRRSPPGSPLPLPTLPLPSPIKTRKPQ